ncbi:MAG TPA: acyl-CoA carboxylase subunit beta [Anaerolineae bacterium]|nr:acyl-CoA carboxylase subunit beta [Anaerolineae bacterium]HQI83251.1 acyl-CoA carboxylase subunit beta [Anaerolineae bacterium]
MSQTLHTRREAARLGGGEARIAAQHAKGKRTARERIAALLDPDSFVETGMFVTHRAVGFGLENDHPAGDGVVTGTGKIEGRPVCVFAQDFTVLGGSVGEAHGRKIARLMDLALQNGVPLIGLNDSGGARIQEGVDALAAYGEIFYRNVQASGVIPQISVILGPCAGGAVYSPAITDFVFMAEQTAHMFITGPDVIRAVTREEVDAETLGGASLHATRSGVAHFTAPDEDAVFAQVRWLLTFLPPNNLTPPPNVAAQDEPRRPTPELYDAVPANPQQPYDVRVVIETLVDGGEFLEVQPAFAQNLVIGFARLDGHPVGIVANQPATLAGVLDIDTGDKGARFIRFCDAFHIPLVTLVDTPGFLPGTDQEHDGIIRHGAKLIFAYAEATVPKVTLILRKAYGGAYIVMGSKHLAGDVNLAWPTAEIAVMGPESAVNVVFRKDLAAAENPDACRADLIHRYREELATPFVAASRGYLDDVINPAESRARLIAALDFLRDKRQQTPKRKHGNIPL